MPLRSGKGQSAISSNIRELLHSWKKSGKMGTSSPKNITAARKQAAAIAYSKARGK